MWPSTTEILWSLHIIQTRTRYVVLKQVLKRTRERITNTLKQTVEGVLSEVFNLVPRVQHIFILICSWKGQLYAHVAVNGSAISIALIIGDCTISFIEANKRISFARIAPKFLPKQVLEGALLKFKYLSQVRGQSSMMQNKLIL